MNTGVFLSAGDDVTVSHDIGTGNPERTTGKVLNPNDNGDIVIEKEDGGEIIRIPRGRIYYITMGTEVRATSPKSKVSRY